MLLILSLLMAGVRAQSYQFFNFGLPEGLCDKFTYTINQDPQGFLWVGTGAGLCRYDGKVFEQQFRGDSLPASIAFSSLLDSRGRLWFGHENGVLSMLENGSFSNFAPQDYPPSAINSIREDSQGNIIALLQQSGLIVIGPELERSIIGDDPSSQENPFAGKFMNCFMSTSGGSLLVGSNDGLSLYAYDEGQKTYVESGEIAELKTLRSSSPKFHDDQCDPRFAER